MFHRYAWILNYGEDMPPDKASLIAKITVPPNQKVDKADLDELINEAVRGFVELGVIKATMKLRSPKLGTTSMAISYYTFTRGKT